MYVLPECGFVVERSSILGGVKRMVKVCSSVGGRIFPIEHAPIYPLLRLRVIGVNRGSDSVALDWIPDAGKCILSTSSIQSRRFQMSPKSFGPPFISGSLAAIAATILLAAPAEAQIQKAVKTSSSTTAGTPMRTPDGQPDLQGVWTNATLTPFERPAELAGKATLTEQEVASIEKAASKNRVDRPPKPGDTGSYNQAWFDSGTTWLSTRQSSLVVDPPNGKVPVKPSAEAQRDYDLAHIADSYEHQTTWERCITRGVPAGMFPAGYNNAYQILQTRAYV